MTTKDIMEKESSRALVQQYTAHTGRIISFHKETLTCSVVITKNGIEKVYGSVPFPSNGWAHSSSVPKQDQLCVVMFIDNNKALPVIICLLNNNGINTESRKDTSFYKCLSKVKVNRGR